MYARNMSANSLQAEGVDIYIHSQSLKLEGNIKGDTYILMFFFIFFYYILGNVTANISNYCVF